RWFALSLRLICAPAFGLRVGLRAGIWFARWFARRYLVCAPVLGLRVGLRAGVWFAHWFALRGGSHSRAAQTNPRPCFADAGTVCPNYRIPAAVWRVELADGRRCWSASGSRAIRSNRESRRSPSWSYPRSNRG